MEKSDSGSLNASDSESTTRRRLGMVKEKSSEKIVGSCLVTCQFAGIRVKTLTPVSKNMEGIHHNAHCLPATTIPFVTVEFEG